MNESNQIYPTPKKSINPISQDLGGSAVNSAPPSTQSPAADWARQQVNDHLQPEPVRPEDKFEHATVKNEASHQYPTGRTSPDYVITGLVEKQKPADMAEIKKRLMANVRGEESSRWHKWKPLIISLAVGLAFMGFSYNEVVAAQLKQYISPGSALTTSVIVDPTQEVQVGNESKIIIPKINVDVPVVYDIKTYEESAIQSGLERGVVHYGTTALPGQIGNNVIVGHSSNNFFNSGKYKFAFVLLDRLEINDTFILHYKGERYIYKVFNKEVIEPTDFSLIQPTDKPITTLITCTPPGTSWKRLVVQAEQISPSPSQAELPKTNEASSDEATIIPGNAPSIWDRIGDWF